MSDLLYVAGPYTHPDPVINTHCAVRVASAIYEAGEWVPVVPHLTLLWHLVDPHPLEFWYEYDLHILERCQAIVRLPGDSTGADKEMEHAIKCGLQVVDFRSLPQKARQEWWT